MSHPDPRWCALIRRQPAIAPTPELSTAPIAGQTPGRTPIVVDRADFDPRYDPTRPIECECCGSIMHYTAACKIECRNCGYKRDCSDP